MITILCLSQQKTTYNAVQTVDPRIMILVAVFELLKIERTAARTPRVGATFVKIRYSEMFTEQCGLHWPMSPSWGVDIVRNLRR